MVEVADSGGPRRGDDLGACSGSRGPDVAYTGPGWYLERPRFLLVTGPEIFAGPMTYEACEAKRVEFETSPRLLCINEKMKPGPLVPTRPRLPRSCKPSRSSRSTSGCSRL